MEKNMGQKDRIVRAMIGAVLLVFVVVFQKFIGALGLVFLLTAAAGTCPVYSILGISTNRYGE